MRDIGALEYHGFRRKLVQIGRVNFDAAVARKRVRSLLIGQKKNQIRFAFCGHNDFCSWTKSVLAMDCNVGRVESPEIALCMVKAAERGAAGTLFGPSMQLA
jgi:hypothetical protein